MSGGIMEPFKPLLINIIGAIIIGGMISMGTVRVMENQLQNMAAEIQRNATSIKELSAVVDKNEDKSQDALKTVSELLVAIRLEMAKRASTDNAIQNLQDRLNTIWPSLREMRERIQKLEPENAPEWRH